jgi:hypothetical protein
MFAPCGEIKFKPHPRWIEVSMVAVHRLTAGIAPPEVPRIKFPPCSKIETKGFPGGGKEHPSRGRFFSTVRVSMTFNVEQKTARPSMVLDGVLQMKRLTMVLVAILSLALLHQPLTAHGATGSGQYPLTLHWDPSSSPGIAGYRVYYGTASGNYTTSVEVGNVTTDTVAGLTGGVTYYFAVTAFDTDGDESDFSNEISLVPGQTAVQLHMAANQQFVLTVSGLTGRTYDILATQDFSAWTVIGTVTLDASGSIDFTDTNAANFSQRFYRTQLEN